MAFGWGEHLMLHCWSPLLSLRDEVLNNLLLADYLNQATRRHRTCLWSQNRWVKSPSFKEPISQQDLTGTIPANQISLCSLPERHHCSWLGQNYSSPEQHNFCESPSPLCCTDTRARLEGNGPGTNVRRGSWALSGDRSSRHRRHSLLRGEEKAWTK